MNSSNTQEKQNPSTDLKNTLLQMLASLAAKITLKYNINYHAFIDYYKSCLVKHVKDSNPDYSMVELSCRTGIDRRYIKQYLNLELLSIKQPKSGLVLNEIKKHCAQNNTKLIKKYGPFESFESICNTMIPGALTPPAVAKELIRLGNIVEKDDKYELTLFSYMPEKNSLYQQFRVLVTEINNLTNTIIYNFDQTDNRNKQFQRNSFSTQIDPKDFSLIKKECTKILSEAKDKVEKIILQYEQDVPSGTYPAFGASFFIFGYENRNQSIKTEDLMD